jgi:hypothetical protein
MTQEVGLLTIDQKNQLVGQYYEEYVTFNPVQDNDGNWIISSIEIDDCVNPDFLWVKTLPLIPWNPPQPVSGSF